MRHQRWRQPDHPGPFGLEQVQAARVVARLHAEPKDVALREKFLVVAADVSGSKMSIRSCASHIATKAVEDFDIDPTRMLWIEYYPGTTYGMKNENRMPETYELVEFTWVENKAIKPKWRPVKPPLLDSVKASIGQV